MTWKDITIGQFQALTEIKEQEFEFTIEKEIAVISCTTGIPIEELNTRPANAINELAKECDFTNSPINEKLKGKFAIGFKRYDIELNANNINAEQFILLNKFTKTEAETISNLHNIMAVLTYHKSWFKRQLFSKDFEAKAALFKERMSIEVAYPVSVFFCKVYNESLNLSQTYLIQKAKQIQAKAAKMKNSPTQTK